MLKFDEQRKTRIWYVFLKPLCHYHCANILKTGFLHRPVYIPAFTKPFFLYPQSQYGPPEARVYCRTKSVAPPASLMV